MTAKKKKSRSAVRKPISILALCAMEVVLIGVGLLAFAYFHHVQPQHIDSVNIVIERPNGMGVQEIAPDSETAEEPFASETAIDAESPAGNDPEILSPESDSEALLYEAVTEDASVIPPTPMMTPEPTPTAVPMEIAADATLPPTPTPQPTPTPDPVGYFGSKFKDKFTNGEVIFTDSSYQSANVNIQLRSERAANALIHVADIYIRDISSFKSGLAFGRVDKNIREDAKDIARRSKALVSLTGDFYSMRGTSVVLRNGVLYRDKKDPEQDVCVLYWDGSVETFASKEFDVYQELQKGAYQVWSFGPMLLDREGNALKSFNHELQTVSHGLERKRARTAFGYYEPGHYCFVAVDYATADSHGLSIPSLSSLMNYLGCKRAYNLDGGQSAQLYVGTKCYNHPENGGRKISDMLIIVEPTAEELERIQ